VQFFINDQKKSRLPESSVELSRVRQEQATRYGGAASEVVVNVETLLVHPNCGEGDGHGGDPFRASAPPIYLSATYDQETPLAFGRYDYSRGGNPTREVLEKQLAILEGAERAFAYPSGVAALDGLATFLRPGDEVLASADLYGGTFRLFTQVWSKRGIVVKYADVTDVSRVSSLITSKTRMMHVEPLGNPMQTVCDIAGLAKVARERGVLMTVDNTSLTPLNIKPLELGAHVVMHSATKYLNGHSDVMAGVLALRDKAMIEELGFHHNAEGVALPPFECAMMLRGMETMALRVARQQESAMAVAKYLAGRKGVARVLYVGLEGHGGRELHRSQSRGDGAVLSFTTGSVERSAAIVQRLKLFAIRVSFGSVSSSVSMPASMSHKSVPAELRERYAPPADLVRLSIGIEDCGDLIADLERAMVG
jgi:cystathionine beta-lyase